MAASSRIICLNLGMQTIGMAEFRAESKGGLVLEKFRLTEILADPAAESTRLAQVKIALNEMKEQFKVKTASASYAIPAQAVFTRFVKLPTVGEEKVEQIIKFEAQQNVPFPIDEVVWDYQLVSSPGSPQMEVVLVAIKSDLLEQVNEAVEECGFRTSTVDVAPMALYNAFRYNYSDVPGCSLLIDVGARTTNLVFVEPGRVFTRSIPIGGTSVSQAIAKDFEEPFGAGEERKRQHGMISLGGAYAEHDDPNIARLSKVIRNSMTKLHADIARSISFYRSQQQGAMPLRAYLCGGAVSLPYAREFFAEKLNLPVEFFNPLRNVSVAPSVNMEDAGKSAHVMGELVGLGLRAVADCPMSLNLPPESVVRGQAMAKRKPYIVMAGICLLLLITGFWLYYRQATEIVQAATKQISEKIVQPASVEAKFKKIEEEKRFEAGLAAPLVQAIEDRDYWVRVIQEINAALPERFVWVTSLQGGIFADKFYPFRLGAKEGGLKSYLPEKVGPAGGPKGPQAGGPPRPGGPGGPGGPGRPGGPSGAQNAKADLSGFGVVLHGLFLANPENAEVVDAFVKRLESSPMVASVAVPVRVTPNEETWAYDFEIHVKLKQAISTP